MALFTSLFVKYLTLIFTSAITQFCRENHAVLHKFAGQDLLINPQTFSTLTRREQTLPMIENVTVQDKNIKCNFAYRRWNTDGNYVFQFKAFSNTRE